jgi:glycosyltransferase involved in cell wall biosynthesis
MKLLIYAPIKYPNAEVDYILILSQKLVQKNIEVVIMASPGNPIIAPAKALGLRVEERFDLLTVNPLKLLGMRRPLWLWLEQEKFDLVDIHRSEGFVVMAGLVKKLKNRPALVRTRQDMRPARTDPINRWTYNSCDLIIASNRLLADDLITRLKINPERLCVIYYGINPEIFQPTKPLDQIRKERGIDPSWRLVGFSARLGIVKGHQYFLQAAEKIAAEIPEARFLISYRMVEKESDFLQKLSQSPLKDKFLVFGPCDNRADLLSLCELGVLASVGSEASSRACLEWMALKKPVVVTRVGVLPELVATGDTGYLVMPRYASGMADAILKLLHYPERAKEMGEAGFRKLTGNFTEDLMIEKTLEAFGQAVKNKS